MTTNTDNPVSPADGTEKKKKRVIPKERYLGVYFKKTTDQDLIDWKKAADESGVNMGDVARSALREKLTKDANERQMEHPSVILKRMEVQQAQLFVMVQQIVRKLQGGAIIGGQVAEGQPLPTDVIAAAPVTNELDQRCAEAGWE